MISVRDRLIRAFEMRWFHMATLVIALLYGFGGSVHIANVLGFGELSWANAPLSWKLGDVSWGILDIVAVVGIALKAPVGIYAVVCAALSQIVVYGLWPESFALNDEDLIALEGMVYFHVVILVVLACLVWFAMRKKAPNAR